MAAAHADFTRLGARRVSIVLLRGCCWLAGTLGLPACQPEEERVDVGSWPCATSSSVDDTPAASEVPVIDAPVDAPWRTGFEQGFCEYGHAGGFCFSTQIAGFELVRTPTRSGNFAAAFTVTPEAPDGAQVRCVRQGVFPTAAYYGAWYYVTERATDLNNWNLFHFQGGVPESQHGLWDVSLRLTPDGELALYVFGFLDGGGFFFGSDDHTIPIGSWFHVQLFIERSADATGTVELYQDGELVARATDVITDDTGWGQWYVGNLAIALAPSPTTVYVDDVTISATR